MDELDELKDLIARSGEAVLSVKVTPRSSRNRIVGRLPNGAWKVKVAAVPEKGQANEELCTFLAEVLDLPRSHVTVERGHSSSLKRIRARR